VREQFLKRIALNSPIGRWRKRARWAQRKLKTLPAAMWVIMISIAALAVFPVTNFVHQVLRKPAEVFAPISDEFNKAPSETWRQYAPLFREYSTASISPELLAALAQVESAGNPLATTYWRWHLMWNPFSVYQPASSAVGMYQMTDAAYGEAHGYCILHHTVVEDGCSWTGLDSRVLPSRATELTAVFLERNIVAIIGHRRTATVSPQQKQELAAIIHLCGAGPARAFVRRGFHLLPGERCGDHNIAAYLSQLKAMKQEFLRFAAES
jgi:Transglycosylase SLT domain